MPTIKVVDALRFFVREGVQGRGLRATTERACGSTLRRRLDEWSAMAVRRRVRILLLWTGARVPRPPPGKWPSTDDQRRCSSVRATRSGGRIGPNPSHRGKAGTRHHVVAATDGLPLAAIPLGRQPARHAARPPPSALGPGGLRHHRPALRGCGRRQRRKPWPLPAGGQPALCPQGGRAARLRARRGPRRGRARVRVAAGQQAARSASGPAELGRLDAVRQGFGQGRAPRSLECGEGSD